MAATQVYFGRASHKPAVGELFTVRELYRDGAWGYQVVALEVTKRGVITRLTAVRYPELTPKLSLKLLRNGSWVVDDTNVSTDSCYVTWGEACNEDPGMPP